jgi:hypothetical protein
MKHEILINQLISDLEIVSKAKPLAKKTNDG